MKKHLFIKIGAIVLALLVLTLLTLFFFVKKEQEAQAPKESESETEWDSHTLPYPAMLANISPENVTAMTLGDYRYVRTGDTWSCTDYPELPLDNERLTETVYALTRVTSTYLVMDSSDTALYGLSDAECRRATFERETGESFTIRFGEYNEMLDQYYAFTDAISGVYLVDSYEQYFEAIDIWDFLVLDSSDVPNEEALSSVTLTKNGTAFYTENADHSDFVSEWSFLYLVELTPSNVASYKPTAEELAEYGLDGANAVTATLSCEDGDSVVRRLGRVERDSHGSCRVYLQINEIVYLTYISEKAADALEGKVQ